MNDFETAIQESALYREGQEQRMKPSVSLFRIILDPSVLTRRREWERMMRNKSITI